jgi:MFS family permease
MTPKSNLIVLFIAHAVLGSQMPINVVVGGLAGAELAANRALATMPISVIVLSSMLAAPMASWIMGRYGRRAGFLIGAAAGTVGGALSAQAMFIGSFGLLLTGSVFTGIFQGAQGFARFAASDAVPDAMKPKAISWILAAGLFSALLGPEVVRWLADAFAPVPFAGAYVAVIGINIIGASVMFFLRIPLPARSETSTGQRRPVGQILSQPRIVVAIFCGMVSYAVMSLIMTPTSLAMASNGFDANQAADVVRWHVFAMFLPSFFTGHLISRFGHGPIIATGLVLLAVCAGIALSGVDLHHFYIALITLGIGWNFGFIGATSLLATLHSPEEQSFVQGLNDFLVFGLVATASFGSGALLTVWGWNAVQLAAIPAVLAAVGVLIFGLIRSRPHPQV